MKANEYLVLERCVADGIEAGLNRAHKYTDTPNREVIQSEIYVAVLREICDYFNFDLTQNDDDSGTI